jgi:hypothetical protein
MDISFEEMLQLMNQCHDFVSPLETSEKSSKSPRVAETVLFGIVPGLNTLIITCLSASFASPRTAFIIAVYPYAWHDRPRAVKRILKKFDIRNFRKNLVSNVNVFFTWGNF